MISPERLGNEDFRNNILIPSIQHQIKPAYENSEIQKDTPVYPTSQTIYETELIAQINNNELS